MTNNCVSTKCLAGIAATSTVGRMRLVLGPPLGPRSFGTLVPEKCLVTGVAPTPKSAVFDLWRPDGGEQGPSAHSILGEEEAGKGQSAGFTLTTFIRQLREDLLVGRKIYPKD